MVLGAAVSIFARDLRRVYELDVVDQMTNLYLEHTMNLSEFAKTEKQREYVEAYERHGCYEEAGREMGVTGRAIRAAVDRVRMYSTDTEDYVPGSRMVDGDGNVKIQWMKPADKNAAIEEAREEAREALLSSVDGKARVLDKDYSQSGSMLLNLYNVTDFHFGMKAWAPETGADWDIPIAKRCLEEYVDEAISRAPKADVSILSQLGDFFHYDSYEAVTPTSGHLLDADTRYGKMVREGVDSLRQFVERLREVSDKVVVLMAEGNHDIASSLWLRELFRAYYSSAPDVEVMENPAPFYSYLYGKTALFFHHGHKVKFEKLPEFFAARFPSEFGKADYRYIHCGHFHHHRLLETNLGIVEQHPTLAAPDAYSARAGFDSQRSGQVITYHFDDGEVSRHTIRPAL